MMQVTSLGHRVAVSCKYGRLCRCCERRMVGSFERFHGRYTANHLDIRNLGVD